MHDHVRLGGLCWVLSAEFFLAQLIAHLAAPGHDLFLYDISLLGISHCGVFLGATSGSTDLVCSPMHLVFNFGIILHGALVILGVWLTRSFWAPGIVASLGLVLLALGGVGTMVVGAYPLDHHMVVPILGAVTAIAAPGLGLLLLARGQRQFTPALARWSLAVGLLVMLAGLGHALGGLPFGRGTMERLAVWPQTLWFASVGTTLLVGSTANQATRPAAFPRPLWQRRTGATRRAALAKRHV